jgi:hypothetical protein
MRLFLMLSAWCGLALGVGAAFGQPPIDDLYAQALAGDKSATEKCIEELEAVVRAQPQNQLAHVYLGSSYTLRSRDIAIGPEKLRLLRRGIAVMDAAVQAAPDDAQVWLVRALTDEALPFFAGRGEMARAEFLALAEMAATTQTPIGARDWQLLYLHAGQVAQKEGDKERASKYFRIGLTKKSNPELTAQLQAALAKL